MVVRVEQRFEYGPVFNRSLISQTAWFVAKALLTVALVYLVSQGAFMLLEALSLGCGRAGMPACGPAEAGLGDGYGTAADRGESKERDDGNEGPPLR
jgi:hypothetical protein